MLTKQEMYAFPTACVDIFGESVGHSTFFAHMVDLMRQNFTPSSVLFRQYCDVKASEEDGDPVEWDGIVYTNLVEPLEKKGYVLDSYNYEMFMSFIHDYVYVTLEKGGK